MGATVRSRRKKVGWFAVGEGGFIEDGLETEVTGSDKQRCRLISTAKFTAEYGSDKSSHKVFTQHRAIGIRQ
nr:hypothetical protein Itr_chr10CG00730 [Ipomoea trifida]